MADEEQTEATEEQKAQEVADVDAKKKSKKMIIIGSAIAATLLIIAIVLFFVFSRQKALSADAALSSDSGRDYLVEQGYGDDEELLENEVALGAMFPLESFVVNLAGGGFIRIHIQLEFAGRTIPKRFMARLVPIRDTLIALLSSRRRSDLLNRDGKEDLKGDIITLINEMLGKEDVKNVYFTNFVIQ